jgi:hypothetical protein
MNPLNIATGFIPLALFALLASWLPLGWAAAAGLALAVVIIAVTAARGGVKILSVAQFVTLAALTVVGFTAGHAATAFAPYAGGTASLALGAFILVTSFSFPFTVQFARRSVPQQYWKSPQFLGVNRRISLAWGLAVLGIGAGHLGAAYVGSSSPVVHLLLDWGVPLFAAYRAYSVTKRTIAQNAHAPQHDGTGQPAVPVAH